MDVKNLMAIMETMQMMRQFQEQQAQERATQAEPDPVTPKASAAAEVSKFYDDPIQSEGLKMMKAAIPFLNPAYQKQMGLLAKALELKKLLEYYQQQALVIQSKQEDNWQRGMLLAVRPHMSNDKKHKIDLLVHALDMQEIIIKMNEVNNHDNSHEH